MEDIFLINVHIHHLVERFYLCRDEVLNRSDLMIDVMLHPIHIPAKAWWQDKQAQIVTPSRLPWQQPLGEIVHPRWRREQQTLDASHLKQLTRLGTSRGLFAKLALWSEDEALTVGIPVASPAKQGQPTNRSTFIALHYVHHRQSLNDHAQRLQEDLLADCKILPGRVWIWRTSCHRKPGVPPRCR